MGRFEVQRINERELALGTSASWHDQYKNSAYVYAGGLDYELTEGDIIAVFSQYGEIVDCNLVRDKTTGKSKGFCFIAYEDQKSTVLCVDNLNGAVVCGRNIKVDHVQDYRPPKLAEGEDGREQMLREWIRIKSVLPPDLKAKFKIPDEFANRVDAALRKDKEEEEEKGKDESANHDDWRLDEKIVKLQLEIDACDPEDPMAALFQQKFEKRKAKLIQKQLQHVSKDKKKKKKKKKTNFDNDERRPSSQRKRSRSFSHPTS